VSLADIPFEEYRFFGFLPKKKGYQTKLDDIATYLETSDDRAVLFYESPNRIRRVLTELAPKIKHGRVIIGRELTKKFESIDRGELTQDFIQKLPEKGEYTILVYSAPPKRS
jgi:16S rRNA (cytidine1402-2'-O)-methyltransferase